MYTPPIQTDIRPEQLAANTHFVREIHDFGGSFPTGRRDKDFQIADAIAEHFEYSLKTPVTAKTVLQAARILRAQAGY